MTTIREMVDDIDQRLHSFTGTQEQFTYLTAPIDVSATTLNVGHPDVILKGLIEIDDELMLVDRAQDANVTLYPFGRAQGGTTAASHAQNARVVNDPQFPRQAIFKAVAETIDALHPTLFQVKKTELTWSIPVFTYALPADVDRVLEVKYDTIGPYKVWNRSINWSEDLFANTADFPSGKSIEIRARIVPGQKVQITYAAPFSQAANFTQSLSDLGVPRSAEDVVLFGAMWRLMTVMEGTRLQMEAVEQYARQQAVQPGAITAYKRELYATFQQRLGEERARLLTLAPRPIHFTR